MSLDADIAVRFDRLALDVKLRVASGEVVALVGPSGAGKTTVLRAIAGLRALTKGRVALDGAVYEDTATGEYVPPERRNLGVVFQDALLFPHLSVVDNVGAGLWFTGTSRPIARARAREWLERIGIAELAAAMPSALSGGQAQRVALARALASQPTCCSSTSRSRRSTSRRGPRSAASSAATSRRSAASGCSSPTTRSTRSRSPIASSSSSTATWCNRDRRSR